MESAQKNIKPTNNLINETSPYLLQHAYNPVDWYPWGNEALKKAQKENKLLIISIGYSACHWCHVMEHESFEDNMVAETMNNNYVSIKVDREERPDIDDVYMTACNLISGRGGWPLNAIALPDGRPIWAGTYFPKQQWLNILNQIANLYENNPKRLEETAEKLVTGLRQVDLVQNVNPDIGFYQEDLDQVVDQFLKNMDFEWGGSKGNPKFPMPNNLDFLLKCAFAYPDSKAREAVETSLKKMAYGGIYDQLEGGFARYSVDSIWKIPHFEKMLYDNAQLISTYSQAYKSTKNPFYRRVAEESLQFIFSNWKDQSGGYFSSFDADSEGVEGKYYVWDQSEIESIITDEKSYKMFVDYFEIKEHGNWEETNILYTYQDERQFAEKYGKTETEFLKIKEDWKELLLEKRKDRIKPGLDDKILCSWNALLLIGLCDAFEAFGDEKYRSSAIELYTFIDQQLKENNTYRLNRNFKEGKVSINAFLDDYAFTISGLIKLYQITFDEKYLTEADQFMKYVIKHFYQKNESVMFNFTSDLDPALVARKSELNDGVIPGSNSAMARNLHSLGLLLYNNDYLDRSAQMLRNMKNSILNTSQPGFYSNWCNLLFDHIFSPYEVAIVGENAELLRKNLSSYYHPNAIFLGSQGGGGLKLLKNKYIEGETYIYVCVDKACKLPVKEVEKARKLMPILAL